MKKLFTFLLLVIFTTFTFAAKKPAPPAVVANPLPAVVGYIIDGDTFSAQVILENKMKISVRIRIMQIDAPEMSGQCDSEIAAAHASRDRLAELIPVGSTVILSGIKDDKYLGRIDAFVADGNGRDVGEIMVRENHARPYDGGKRDGWCD